MKGMVAGASGLVGGHCVRLLLLQNSLVISSLELYGRKQPELKSRMHFVPTDFQNFPPNMPGHVDFAVCALGTTIKKAGSPAAFQKVDYDFVLNFAKHAIDRGVKKMILISAAGANADSKILYNAVKGKTEQALKQLNFESLVILRPSLLLGERDEFRLAESVAIRLEPIYRPLLIGPLKNYKPVQAGVVAAVACRKILDQAQSVEIIENKEIHDFIL